MTLGMLYLSFAKAFAKPLIYFMLFLGAIISGIFLIIAIMVREIFTIILTSLVFGLSLLYVYYARRRVPFAVVLLKTSISLTQKYPGTIGASIAQIFVFITYCAGVVFALLQAWLVKNEYAQDAALGLILFSFYWTTQVIANVVHTTNCGAFASWYFMSNTPSMPIDPTMKSLKRTTTYSFGSVCFGSLFIAIIMFLRQLVKGAARSAAGGKGGGDSLIILFILCIMSCFLELLKNVVEYFNTVCNAYCHYDACSTPSSRSLSMVLIT